MSEEKDSAASEADKAVDVDPRESEQWFSELPDEERERLRSKWHDERHKFDHMGKSGPYKA